MEGEEKTTRTTQHTAHNTTHSTHNTTHSTHTTHSAHQRTNTQRTHTALVGEILCGRVWGQSVGRMGGCGVVWCGVVWCGVVGMLTAAAVAAVLSRYLCPEPTHSAHNTQRAQHTARTTHSAHDTQRARHTARTTHSAHDTQRARHTARNTQRAQHTARNTARTTHSAHDTQRAQHTGARARTASHSLFPFQKRRAFLERNSRVQVFSAKKKSKLNLHTREFRSRNALPFLVCRPCARACVLRAVCRARCV
jgi:hypothetical protein